MSASPASFSSIREKHLEGNSLLAGSTPYPSSPVLGRDATRGELGNGERVPEGSLTIASQSVKTAH